MGGNRVQDVGNPLAPTDAANKAYVDRGLRKAYEGTAIALAISQPVFAPGQTFAVRAGWGGYEENQNAFGLSAAGIIGHGWFGGNSTVALDGGIGFGENNQRRRQGRRYDRLRWRLRKTVERSEGERCRRSQHVFCPSMPRWLAGHHKVVFWLVPRVSGSWIEIGLVGSLRKASLEWSFSYTWVACFCPAVLCPSVKDRRCDLLFGFLRALHSPSCQFLHSPMINGRLRQNLKLLREDLKMSSLQLASMIKSTIMALHQANQTGNYSAFCDLGTPVFRERFDQTQLAAILLTCVRERSAWMW